MKILFLAANPRDMDRLKLDEEVREIDQVLRRADYRDQFELVTHWAVRNNELLELLQRHKPDIVHFSGHGTADDQIMLVNESGTSQPISGRLLARIFSVLKGNIRCVVLNACYSPTQAEAIAEHIEVVIGMSNQIADQASYEFSGAFYQGLAYGQTAQTAFDLGAIRIEMADPNTQAEPVLFAKHADASKIIFVHATPAPTADQMDTSTARREINADSPLTALKRQRLKTQLEDLKRQLEAVFQELRVNNNPVARDRLEIQRSQLEEDMAKAEADLEALV